MATICKRENLQWQAQIMKKGYPTQFKTFCIEGNAWVAVMLDNFVYPYCYHGYPSWQSRLMLGISILTVVWQLKPML